MTLMTHEQRVEAKAREIQERLGILNRQRKPQRRRLLAELQNAAMDDIHGAGMGECDSNGEA